jgi:GR25 family glycosyltransferase involved in LPS biosynthesis
LEQTFEFEKRNEARALDNTKDKQTIFFDASETASSGRWVIQSHKVSKWGTVLYRSELVARPSATVLASNFPPEGDHWEYRSQPAKGLGMLVPMLLESQNCSVPLDVGPFKEEAQELPVFIINLDRSRGRLASTTEAYEKTNPDAHPLVRVQAIDGQKVYENDFVDTSQDSEAKHAEGYVFPKYANMFPETFVENLRRAGVPKHSRPYANVVACCLSHMRAWESLLVSGAEGGVIIEDDTELDAGFGPALLAALTATQHDMKGIATDRATAEGQYDLVFIAHAMETFGAVPNTIIPLGEVAWYSAGATGYYLSRAGAVNLISAVARTGFFAAADYFLYYQIQTSDMKIGYTLKGLGRYQGTGHFKTTIHR